MEKLFIGRRFIVLVNEGKLDDNRVVMPIDLMKQGISEETVFVVGRECPAADMTCVAIMAAVYDMKRISRHWVGGEEKFSYYWYRKQFDALRKRCAEWRMLKSSEDVLVVDFDVDTFMREAVVQESV